MACLAEIDPANFDFLKHFPKLFVGYQSIRFSVLKEDEAAHRKHISNAPQPSPGVSFVTRQHA